MNHAYFIGILSLIFLSSCGNEAEKESVVRDAPAMDSTTVTPTRSGYRFETFQNVDSLGNTFGYGYDIYDGEKKIIHQTNIPGEPGVEGFVNDKEAALIANVVVEKLKAGGGMPTIEHMELVDYGITLKQR